VTRKNPRKPRSAAAKLLRLAVYALLGSIAALALGGYALYRHLEPQLPDIEVLEDIRFQIPMSIYSKDRLLIAQYGEKKRIPIAVTETPKQVVQAFLAAEDNRFFDHPGVDYQGLMRATFSFLRTGEKKQGGSTITMQVARNFFLSSEKTFFRKIKEIMLAVKIDSKLPKEKILELYLNKIYFGHHAYGIGAAAQVYYGKEVKDLLLPEIAMIAGLPKAPSSFNPIVNPERARSRRNYVLNRMRKLGFIDVAQYEQAATQPETASLYILPVELNAPYIAEMVRNEMYRQYGEDAYTNGYRVYTTIDSKMHALVEKSLRAGLHEYDERHGYRRKKPQQSRIDLKKLKTPAEWDQQLAPLQPIGETVPGLVVGFKDGAANVYLGGGQRAVLESGGVRWASRGVKDLLKAGDIIRLRKDKEDRWRLTQIPEAQGALVALDAKTGAVVALAGGYDFARSTFNRATQAQRQPGSGFKPILYAAALSEGYTPSSVVNDAPIAYADPSQAGGVWRPKNYSGRYYGPTRLRVALAKSRNLVSIRLLKSIGLKKAIATAIDFGFEPNELPNSMPLALGSGSATPLRMAQAYSVFANGGFRVEPYFIEKIETDDGKLVYEASPQIACQDCVDSGNPTGNLAHRVVSPQVHYMMNSMLQDVVRMGTATKALELGRSDLAGKTGTTNEYRDAWFNGYVPGLAAVAWIGFDSSKPLGHGETGGTAALPMWMTFMREALKDVPESSFPLPSGLTTARVDPYNGSRASGGNSSAAFEVYPTGRNPRNIVARRPRPEGSGGSSQSSSAPGRDSAPEPAAPRPSAAQKPLESLF
jgi:penicillin-binding protein 1A